MASGVQSSWLAIEAENLSRHDIILFSTSHPILIQSTGLWLARRPAEQRPSIFFRFGDSTLVDRRTGKTRGAATLYRAASKDLCTCPGHERVFFIGNSQGTVRAVTRVCHRRTFLMPLPKHYGDFSTIPVRPDVPTVYLHFNFRSGQLAHGASEIISASGGRPESSVRGQVFAWLRCRRRHDPRRYCFRRRTDRGGAGH